MLKKVVLGASVLLLAGCSGQQYCKNAMLELAKQEAAEAKQAKKTPGKTSAAEKGSYTAVPYVAATAAAGGAVRILANEVDSLTSKKGKAAEAPEAIVTFEGYDIAHAEMPGKYDRFVGKLADTLKSDKYDRIEVVGHADSTGEASFNKPLSQNRARNMATALENAGVDKKKIKSVTGKGSSDPLATNATKEGRMENRRVDVHVFKKN